MEVGGVIYSDKEENNFSNDDGLIPIKREKEFIVPDEDGLIRVKKEELLDPDEGSEDYLDEIKETSFSALEADLESKENVISHDMDDKSFCCAHCEYKTRYPNRFKRHIKTRHIDGKYHKCPHCDYKSLKTSHLKTHITSRHTDEKPYECPHCDFKTVRITNVKRHVMAHHTGEKPHKCSYCDYKTIQYFTLKKHIMAHHTGEKPHHCFHCNYKTLHPYDLKRHIMIHHTGEKPFHCSHCDYRSVRLRDLKRHIVSHHTESANKTRKPKKKASKQGRVIDTTRTLRRSARSTIKGIEPKRQLAKTGHEEGKRPRNSPGSSGSIAKKPKVIVGVSKTHTEADSGYRVAIVPSNYPLTQLSHEQCEVLKEMITDKLDEIDETRDDHPLFNGISFKMGGCILSCDNEASKTWLSKVIPDIIIGKGITLRAGVEEELVKIMKVSSFFPGKKMTEEALLKRLRVQNPKIEGVRSWSLHFMKQMEKGFFATLGISETSLKSLKTQSMQVGYGLGRVTFKQTTEEVPEDLHADIPPDSSS
ncbi:unnamed protein product [Nezara viridula]|uniref:C2H2-type domain-containing protein n=1 Tax=Nezara viridula TaxID=85310 RepID=A0A9P0H6Q0_NEZVI|nr:unnamed protein product [Nezara viridula]